MNNDTESGNTTSYQAFPNVIFQCFPLQLYWGKLSRGEKIDTAVQIQTTGESCLLLPRVEAHAGCQAEDSEPRQVQHYTFDNDKRR